MRKHLLEYALLMAFVALASAGLFVATSSFPVQSAGANPHNDMLPFDCSLPPQVSPAEVPCRP
jgi:hypothetical protein